MIITTVQFGIWSYDPRTSKDTNYNTRTSQCLRELFLADYNITEPECFAVKLKSAPIREGDAAAAFRTLAQTVLDKPEEYPEGRLPQVTEQLVETMKLLGNDGIQDLARFLADVLDPIIATPAGGSVA